MTITTELAATPDSAIASAKTLAVGMRARAVGYDEHGAYPAQDIAELRAAGLLGLMSPVRLGGIGAGFADYVRVAYELARGNGATALIFNMHASVTGALASTPDSLARSLGVPETYFVARDRILTGAAEGKLYAVAMSERGAGARLSEMTTAYQRVEGGYRITGDKTFVSGAGHADGYLVAATQRKDDHVAVSHFLVPAGAAASTLGNTGPAACAVEVEIWPPELPVFVRALRMVELMIRP